MFRRGNYAPDIVRHGMRNGQVGITIDGMQIFGACTDRMDPITSYVEANNLNSISTNDQGQGCHTANIAGGVDLKLKEPAFGGDDSIFGDEPMDEDDPFGDPRRSSVLSGTGRTRRSADRPHRGSGRPDSRERR